jgi:hypothetical protein
MNFSRFLKSKAPDPPTIETEPIVAYRSWRLVESPEGVPLLYSVIQDYVWAPREPARGDVESAVGIFSFKRVEDARSYLGDGSLLGEVSLWGTVIEHRDGYRAEFGYPKRLFVDSQFDASLILRLEDTYGVPIEIKEDWPDTRPFYSSNLSAGIMEVCADIEYDHEPLKPNTLLFCIPLGQQSQDCDGAVITKDQTLTSMLMPGQLQAPERFLLRGIRLIFFENGIPLPITDPLYWNSFFNLQIGYKSYWRSLCGIIADPGLVMQNTDWTKIAVDQRLNLLSRSEFHLDGPGFTLPNNAGVEAIQGVMIEQQQPFCAKIQLGINQKYEKRSVLCCLTGMKMRAVI